VLIAGRPLSGQYDFIELIPIDGIGQFNKAMAWIDDLDQLDTKQFLFSMYLSAIFFWVSVLR
jgi:hypothetical protein